LRIHIIFINCVLLFLATKTRRLKIAQRKEKKEEKERGLLIASFSLWVFVAKLFP